MSGSSYKLEPNYIQNFKNHLNNLNNNSSSIISDLHDLEILLEEIKQYNNKGIDISNIINLIDTHNNDLKLCLNEVYINIKNIDNRFSLQINNLNNTTKRVISKNKKKNYLCCCFKL
tara:strand:+ start:198 stop:548 length:351 start_codon:yes stop_codon:yes gene_type:complete